MKVIHPDAATFAAARKPVLQRAEDRLRPVVRTALVRIGLSDWHEGPVETASAIFADVFAEETDVPFDQAADLAAEFARSLVEALGRTRPQEDRERQEDTLTRWLASTSVNAATEAATVLDPGDAVLEWTTMLDDSVRAGHRDVHGQRRPAGEPFDVSGVALHYPGEPVGDPSNWINCRCLLRPAAAEATGTTATFAAEERPTAVVVALPAEGDDVHGLVGDGNDPAHVTLVYLAADDRDGILEDIATAAGAAHPFKDTVSGQGTLGKDEADVLLLDGAGLKALRDQLLDEDAIEEGFKAVNQFPNWTPHLTVGYPDTPRAEGEAPGTIRFDRLAYWNGEDRVEVPLAGASEENMVAAAENEPPEEDAPAEIPEDEMFEPVPWHGVLAPEGKMSGDGRQFADGALTNRPLPLPLKWMPADDEGHKGSVVVANITRIFREDGLVKAEGVFDQSENSYEAIRLIANDMLRGVSVDLDSMEGAVGEEDSLQISAGRISAATLCAIPAFAEAFISLGPWEEVGGEELEETEGEAEQVEEFAISEESWDGSASRFDDEQWKRSCILDKGESHSTPKERYGLPIREPNGDLSRAGAHAAAARINQVDAPAEAVSKAKNALKRAYSELDEEAPEVLGGGEASFAADAPGLKKDGTPPVCNFCENEAVGYVLHSEGMAFTPFCADHEQDAKDAASSTPDGESDPGNINRVGEYAPVPAITKDGPGWITHPRPTRRITDYWVDGVGAAKIGWGMPGDFNRCRTHLAKYVQNPAWLAGLCANLHYRALRVWPGQHSLDTEQTGGLTASINLTEEDTRVIPADYFRDPGLTGPTPIDVTEDGRIFGHLATYGVCHVGIGDKCVEVPRSKANYAYFLTGQVDTDAGPVNVGQISLGGGHASLNKGYSGALAHYDDVSTAVADVTVGEDAHGVWISGKVRDDVDATTLAKLKASPLSGDWRIIGGHRELVAALSVNVPGFPVPRVEFATDGGEVTALVAAGAVPHDEGEQERISRLVDARLARLDRERRAEASLGALNETRQGLREKRAQQALSALAQARG